MKMVLDTMIVFLYSISYFDSMCFFACKHMALMFLLIHSILMLTSWCCVSAYIFSHNCIWMALKLELTRLGYWVYMFLPVYNRVS